MQPALSREGVERAVWNLLNEHDHGSYRTTRDFITALAAALGFTREDVTWLRQIAEREEHTRGRVQMLSLADRIEALLPPEDAICPEHAAFVARLEEQARKWLSPLFPADGTPPED